MSQAIRETEKLLGKVSYEMSSKKKTNRRFARSLYVSKDIKKGEVFTINNIKSVRPSNGLHPRYLQRVLGKKASKDLPFATPLKREDVVDF
jgi:pseudaminic acid synthase